MAVDLLGSVLGLVRECDRLIYGLSESIKSLVHTFFSFEAGKKKTMDQDLQ